MKSPESTRYLEESLQIFRQLRLPARADQAQQALNRRKHSVLGYGPARPLSQVRVSLGATALTL